MGWFKERGGNWVILVIAAAIVVAVGAQFFDKNSLMALSTTRKVIVIGSLAAMIFVFIGGDRISIFAPNSEKKWKSGFALWIISIFALFAIAVITATTGTPHL